MCLLFLLWLALAGYVVFATTDWQVDVPVFAFLLAGLLALSVPKPEQPGSRSERFVLAALALLVLLIGVAPDPARLSGAINAAMAARGTDQPCTSPPRDRAAHCHSRYR